MRTALPPALLLLVAAAELPPPPKPVEPADAPKTFRLPDGFALQPVAVEPQVCDPVAAAYDEDGRLYVVEMRDYPVPNEPGKTPLGRVRLLEDKDGDGRYETATVFADGLPWPTGVACHDGGVFVTAAPDLWYLKDTTGDRVADVKRKAYTGFVVFNVQALVNGLQWGVDNKLYGVTGGNGGGIVPGDVPDAKPVPVRGRDFRIDPRAGTFETLSGTAQFGNTFDDWYERFVCANRLVCGHVAIPAHALARNPHLAAGRPIHDCAAEGSSEVLPMFQASPPEAWRAARVERFKADKSSVPASEMAATGVFTSGTGITIYRGNAYPQWKGQMFVGNVAGNLVHRRSLTPTGATFTATRIDDGKEVIASTDNWFRPANFVNAPDGCLHVLDMYREVVEHPWSIPEDLKAQLRMTSGNDRGRVWRLAPAGFKPPPPPKLGSATTAELVKALENPSSWWRETAQRLLVARQDKTAVDALRALAREGKSPLARLHAAYTLDGLGELTDPDVLALLQSDHPRLRDHGVMLAEPRLNGSDRLTDAVCAAAADPDARVRFRVAVALGERPSPADHKPGVALAAVARTDAADPLTRVAVLSSSSRRSHQLFLGFAFGEAFPGRLELLDQLAAVVGARNRPEELTHALIAVASNSSKLTTAERRDLLLALGDGLMRAGTTLRAVVKDGSQALFDGLVKGAVRDVGDTAAPAAERAKAVRLLAHTDFATAKPAYELALDPRQPPALGLAAVRGLRLSADPGVPELLLARWKLLTPVVRAEAVATLSGRPAWSLALLDAVAAGTVARTQVDSTRQALLKGSKDVAVRERAEKVFAPPSAADRVAAVEKYKAAAAAPGASDKGMQVFRRECAGCHRAGNVGQIVGPAVPEFAGKSPLELLTAILDPNREVDPRFVNYAVTLSDGRATSGLIGGESPTAVTLRRADAVSEVVLRAEIDEVRSTNLSLMPEGFEQKITPAEMADLLAFLRRP